tara:strand:- start:20 stop:421 length:402 start_codon:yes stop_codon:yes gene_type:complete
MKKETAINLLEENNDDFHDKVEMLQMGIISYEPKYSRGNDDVEDPLPKGFFYAHVSWDKHRHICDRSNELTIHDSGEGDLYFYKPSGSTWHYEFRFRGGMVGCFRNGSVSSQINCNSFMKWFVDYINNHELDI